MSKGKRIMGEMKGSGVESRRDDGKMPRRKTSQKHSL